MLKKVTFFAWAVMASAVISAQSLTPKVVASGGGFKSTSAGSLTFTIGEVAVTTFSKTNSILTQGFEQGTMKNGSSVVDIDAGDVSIQLFPSPASTYIEFNIETKESQDVSIAIYDILGNKVCDVQDVSSSGSTHHAVHGISDMANAVYFAMVSVTDNNGYTRYYSRRFIINN
jgi:hypothetical protein